MSAQDITATNQLSIGNGSPNITPNPNPNEPINYEQVERARAQTEEFQAPQKRYKTQSGHIRMPGSVAQDEHLDVRKRKLPRARRSSSETIRPGDIDSADTTVQKSPTSPDRIAPVNFPALRLLSANPVVPIIRNPDLIKSGVTHALFHPTLGIIPIHGWLVRELFPFLAQISPLTSRLASMDHLTFGANRISTNVLGSMEQRVTPDPPFDANWDPGLKPPAPNVHDGINEVISLTNFVISSAAGTPAPANIMSIVEARIPLQHQRMRSTHRIDPSKMQTMGDTRRNMDFLANELPVTWDDDFIDREVKDPDVENLKHLVAIGVMKAGSPIVLAALRQVDKEIGEGPKIRHLLERKWQSERSASSRYTLNRGDQSPEYAFNLDITNSLGACFARGGPGTDEIIASAKRYKQQQLEKQSFKTYDNLFTAVMEEIRKDHRQDYGDEDSESREDGHDGFDDDGDDSGNGNQLRMEILMLRTLAQRRQSTTIL
ncbi:uncharacterized protein PAC_14900 [Phialocephala subalpina]|uniref:Uncharacterized protein n=1 Tax=Phialocephala subalpina TaxID=576137 RepID=A0A1L7XIY6_9HELO|nr:uncharacterized protein PAC_14900 [Phialocephala subalpina]